MGEGLIERLRVAPSLKLVADEFQSVKDGIVAGTVEKWLKEQAEYPANEQGQTAAAAVRLCARELKIALDRWLGGKPTV